MIDFWLFFQLVLEGVRARQLQGALIMENDSMQKAIQRTRESVDLYDMKAARIEDQVSWNSNIK